VPKALCSEQGEEFFLTKELLEIRIREFIKLNINCDAEFEILKKFS
jgi:hypothetical protein